MNGVSGMSEMSEMNQSGQEEQNPACTLRRGTVPLLVSMPHIGTAIPPELQAAYMPEALKVEDTDWHLQTLYSFLPEIGASVLTPHYSRYVIDLNRPPDDAPMYPGASNTELCPTRFSRARRSTSPVASPPPMSAQGGARPTGSPTMRRWPPSWRASRPCMALRCCGTPTASVRRFPGCLKARCPTSTSERWRRQRP